VVLRESFPKQHPEHRSCEEAVQLMAVALQRIFRLLRLSRGHLAVSSLAQDAEHFVDPAVVFDNLLQPQLRRKYW
jgi:hypothetical protein